MRISFGNGLANLFARSFFRHLTAAIGNVSAGNGMLLVARAEKSAQALFDSERHKFPDKRARLILGWSVITLAGYREVLHETGDSQKTFDIVRQASNRTFQTPIAIAFRALLRFVRDPVALLSRMPLGVLSQKVTGPMLAIAHTFKTPDKTTLTVTHCPFHHFFTEHGAPQLTRILCEWDRIWLDVFDASKRPIRSERPSTISTGSTSCQFHLIRDNAKAGKESRDVILGWVAPEAGVTAKAPERQ